MLQTLSVLNVCEVCAGVCIDYVNSERLHQFFMFFFICALSASSIRVRYTGLSPRYVRSTVDLEIVYYGTTECTIINALSAANGIVKCQYIGFCPDSKTVMAFFSQRPTCRARYERSHTSTRRVRLAMALLLFSSSMDSSCSVHSVQHFFLAHPEPFAPHAQGFISVSVRTQQRTDEGNNV